MIHFANFWQNFYTNFKFQLVCILNYFPDPVGTHEYYLLQGI